MTNLKKLAFAAIVALALVGGAVASGPARQLAGDPSQWRPEAKVNEYEGQHRVANFTKIDIKG